ncbi:tubulin-folding cofactor E isoform X2 [Gossypium australe]|uniref:Tubulin-folding cofactor E isoform X2 n=1 Tax=Gossypium australe TaxID=47621 RepID=A0A5B6WYM8_9ROSI|nr:tubulin-folding cofactor E isoform X2 [Gossypium australe]
MEQTAFFTLGQRVHSSTDPRRVGTVKFVGNVEGYSGTWVGVDWDNEGDGKHDGSINGVRYFQGRSQNSASFLRPQNLSPGISLLQALKLRYQSHSTEQDEDEMYVLSASNKRVSVQLLGKDKIQDKLSRFEELTSASISYLGVSTPGDPAEISASVPNLKELDLMGNLITDWKDVGTICEQLPHLVALNLSNNLMTQNMTGLPLLKAIRVLVLNSTGINWSQVEILEHSLLVIEELHLMGNNISSIKPTSSSTVQGFDSLRLLNLEDNCLAEWDEIMKLSQLKSLEQLYLNKNKLTCIFYPDKNKIQEFLSNHESCEESYFPLSDNPIADPGRGGLPRFVLIARLAKVEMLNGSEISARERKESEIRYVRLVMSKLLDNPEEINRLHPRFVELKNFYGIEDERPSVGAAGPQKMASGLLSITLKCVASSVGEKLPLTKKLPATTTVGKLKALCESFFKLKSLKLKLFLQEEGSPLPMLLDDEMATLMDMGIGNESTIIVDEES